jgi:hypothetical protein
MPKARKAVFRVLTLLLATGVFAVPAGSANAGSDGSAPQTVAVEAKKKCKKGFVRKNARCVQARKKCKTGFVRKVVRNRRQTCVKKTPPTAPAPSAPIVPTNPGATTPTSPGPTALPWSEGRWRGYYAENSVELLFNVTGSSTPGASTRSSSTPRAPAVTIPVRK